MERFRLLYVASCDASDDLAFLQSFTGADGPVFCKDSASALLMTWDSFIDAAAAVWRSLGPVDIFPDKVYVLPSGGVL